MNGPTLIYGGSQKQRIDRLEELLGYYPKETNPDVKFVKAEDKKKSVSILQVQSAVNFLREKPFAGKRKVLIFFEGEKLPDRAQNLLLKVLEDTPSYAQVFILAKSLGDILDTVTSRCIKISTKHQDTIDKSSFSFEKVLSMSVEDKLLWAEITSKEEREDILKILESWIEESREVFLKKPGKPNLAHIIRNIESKTRDLAGTNVSARLLLESLVLSLNCNTF